MLFQYLCSITFGMLHYNLNCINATDTGMWCETFMLHNEIIFDLYGILLFGMS